MNHLTLNLNVNSKNSVRNLYSKSTFFSIVSMLFVLVLLFSSVASTFTLFASGATDVTVGTETALRAAVNNAAGPTVIALTADIALTGSALSIPSGKDITLVSDEPEGFWKLIGAANQVVITVDGILSLDGIIVTHTNGVGCGINVAYGGTLILIDGEISNNTAARSGGGVYNQGDFKMFGGVISNNTVIDEDGYSRGGGVYNQGDFKMYDGVISNNTAKDGGGVYNLYGSFELSNGIISNNTAINEDGYGNGGGVYNNQGTFEMSGRSRISNNTSVYGGGISNVFGVFEMYGDSVISSNAAVENGGGMYNFGGVFEMFGGVIANNTAQHNGGGVLNWYGDFDMSNGLISNNAAINEDGTGTGGGIWSNGNFVMSGSSRISNNKAVYAGGIYNSGTFEMYGDSVISSNAAVENGGGMYNYIGVFEMFGGVISNNAALNGGGVYNQGDFKMYDESIISSNIAIGNGGGVNNHIYGEFDLTGGTISDNTASNGGGVYVNRDNNFYFNCGTISGNSAVYSGGGIGVYDVACLESVYVFDGAVFSNNHASSAYNRNAEHDDLYTSHIADSVIWSSPFTQGYNNYDISYTYGELLAFYNVVVSSSFAVSSGTGDYLAGETVTLVAGSRDGYTFSGWTVNEGGITLSNTATATFTMPTNDVAVTAIWSPIFYTINYVLNSGTNGAGNPSSYNVGSTFPITINNPSRSGYEFLGWNVLYANGTQASSQVSYRIPAGTTGNVELTANWRTVDTGGGNGGGSGGGDSSPKPSPSPSTPTPGTPAPSVPVPSPSSDGGDKTEVLFPFTAVLVLVIVVLVVVVLAVVGVVVLLLRKGSKV
jgi:uncharacterized repeat protein (TIGR02543 family)